METRAGERSSPQGVVTAGMAQGWAQTQKKSGREGVGTASVLCCLGNSLHSYIHCPPSSVFPSWREKIEVRGDLQHVGAPEQLQWGFNYLNL